jgi:hypothetical protein
VICTGPNNSWQASYQVNEVNPCAIDFVIQGEANGVIWTTGGIQHIGNEVTIVFPNTGNFVVTLTGQPGINCTVTVPISGFCNTNPPGCTFAALFNVDCSRLTVDFTPDAASLGQNWSFSIASYNTLNPDLNGQPLGAHFELPNINTCVTTTIEVTMTVRQ